MNEKHDRETQPDSSRPQPRFWTRGPLVLLFGFLASVLLGIVLAFAWFKEPPRPPALLAGDRQRLEAFLAAHDFEAFLRLMELQPPAVRDELPPEWLRRYDEIKPALLFTVREASTEEVINSEAKCRILTDCFGLESDP